MTGRQARFRCSRLHRSFRPGVYIIRMCNDNKEWGQVDYSSCTMRPEAKPLIMVEVPVNRTVNASASDVVNEVCKEKFYSKCDLLILCLAKTRLSCKQSSFSIHYIYFTVTIVPSLHSQPRLINYQLMYIIVLYKSTHKI